MTMKKDVLYITLIIVFGIAALEFSLNQIALSTFTRFSP